MGTLHIHTDAYFELLRNLNTEAKTELIERLSKSMDMKAKSTKSVYDFSGKWESDKTADEIIEELKTARVFNRVSIDF